MEQGLPYDYIIIGSGPSGLSCAHILISCGYRCLVLEREGTAGGCHRVQRVNGKFTEHGPRIYSSNYKTFYHLLESSGLDPRNYFTDYKFSIIPMGLNSVYSWWELFSLAKGYVGFMLNPSHYKKMTVQQLVANFSQEAQDYTDRICRLTDGAGSNRYTAFEFFQLVDQNIFYQIQQPKVANDRGWVRDLVNSLEQRGVRFRYRTSVSSINKNSNQTTSGYVVKCQDGSNYRTGAVIVATPLPHLYQILSASDPSIKNSFMPIENLGAYSNATDYETYIPVTLHWKEQQEVQEVWGQGIGEWNIAWITLSDYIKEEEGTLISCCISRLQTPSNRTGLTAHQCSREELFAEILSQLSAVLPAKKPDLMILSPDMYRQEGQWKNRDTAYMKTSQSYLFPYKAEGHRIYSIGSHNEKSFYGFTTAESAVQNSYQWAQQHLPKKVDHITTHFQRQSILELKHVIYLCLSIVVLWIIYQIISPRGLGLFQPLTKFFQKIIT